MQSRGKDMTMRRWSTIVVTLLAMTVFLVPITRAADEQLSGRGVQHTQKVEAMEVGDVPGHIVGVAQQAGLMFYSTGEIATTVNTAHFDYVQGKGTLTGYRVTTFHDGSTLLVKAGGTATPVDGGKRTVFEGPVECIGGTGRFEGFKGTGTYKGERVGPVKTGADSYFDFSLTCKKP